MAGILGRGGPPRRARAVAGRILGVMSTPPRRPAARRPARKPPPAWLRRWEDLHVAAQVAIVAPVAIVLLWVGHVVFLNQPVGRGSPTACSGASS